MLLNICADEVLELLEKQSFHARANELLLTRQTKRFFGTFGRTNAAGWQQQRKPIQSNRIGSSRMRDSDVASSEGGAEDENVFSREWGRVGYLLPTVKGKDAWHLPWQRLGIRNVMIIGDRIARIELEIGSNSSWVKNTLGTVTAASPERFVLTGEETYLSRGVTHTLSKCCIRTTPRS